MTIFVLLILSIFLIPVFEHKNDVELNQNKNKILTYKHFVLCFIIAIPGLRSVDVGLDTIRYANMFEDYSVNFSSLFDLGVRTEEGYLLLNKLIHDIFHSFVFMQMTVAILFTIPIYWLTTRYSSKVWLSLVLVIVYIFYYTCFNEMRLSIALGISCFAFDSFVNGNWKKYLFFILIAFFFHHTSIIILPLIVFMFFDRLKKWHILLLIVGFYIVSNFLSQIFTYLVSLQELGYEVNDETGGYGLLALQILTLLLSYIQKSKLLQERYNLCAFYFICATVILFPICHLNPTMFRLQQYCWLPMVILVPNLITSFRNSFVRYFATIAYMALGFVFLFMHSFSENNQIIPYKFFWQ